MPRHEPKPAPDLAFDFLADWRPFARQPDGVDRDWVLHGTIRKRGVTYGLAWRRGMIATCNTSGMIAGLTTLERCAISLAVEFKEQPGWETVPK